MAGTAVIINICDMIDLAIGTPETGVVDFNMLQKVLHCLAQQLGVLDKLVELRNPTLPNLSTDHTHTVNVNEFAVNSSPATKEDPNPKFVVTHEITKEDHKLGRAPSNSILIVERVKKSSFQTPEASPVHTTGGPGAGGGSAGGAAGGGSRLPGRGPSATSGRVPGGAAGVVPGGGQGQTGGSGGPGAPGEAFTPLPTISVGPHDTDDLEGIRKIIPLIADNLAGGVIRINDLQRSSPTNMASPPLQPIAIHPTNVEDTEGIKEAIIQMAGTIDNINGKINELRAAQRTPQPSISLQKITLPTETSDEMKGIKIAINQISQNLPTIVTLLNELSRAASAPGGGPAGLSLVTNSRFNILESAVNELKHRVYGGIPNNQQILEGVRSQTNIKAISDVWTQLNVSSRLEAAEAGLAKLSSLLQDLIVESGGKVPSDLPAVTPPVVAKGPDAQQTQGVTTPGHPGGTQGGGTQPGGTQLGGGQPATLQVPAQQPGTPIHGQNNQQPIQTISVDPADMADLEGLQRNTNKIINNLADVTNRVNELTDAMNRVQGGGMLGPDDYAAMGIDGYNKIDDGTGEFYPNQLGTSALDTGADGVTPASEPGGAGKAEGKPGAGKRGSISAPDVPGGGGRPRRVSRQGPGRPGEGRPPPGLANRIMDLEMKIKICCETLTKENNNNKDMINSLQDQMADLLKQVVMLKKQLDENKLSSDMIKHIESVMELVETVQQMKGQLSEVYETARALADEKENRQGNMNSIIEQLEYLKAVKMDREDLLDAMAEKADLKMVARKVSYDQFEVACDDLARGLDQALGKLSIQESLWQQALDDIQREIETKLDKVELSPLKDFFNDKLKHLQENLKKMALLRRDVEAAGTKKQLLRDVNCISCDADVVMPMENPAAAVSKPMPPSHSMKPYLTYELDTIRKQQASHMKPRNMHDWEAIERNMGKGPTRRPKSSLDSHLCSRYCGGSHTVTTAAQRVARLGHFMKQWGPDVLPLSSALAAGDDGRMYKVTQDPPETGGAAEPTNIKPPPPKAEAVKEAPKPILLTPECRCLEAVGPGKA